MRKEKAIAMEIVNYFFATIDRAALFNRLWKTHARGVDESLMEIDFAVSNLSSVRFFSQENITLILH